MGYKVYLHVFPNGKKYAGITRQRVERRWRKGEGYKQNLHMWNAIKKYGWENIEHIILADGLTAEEAAEMEIRIIAEFDLTNEGKGYNYAYGGTHPNHTEETKRKIGERSKGRTHTQAFRAWISEKNSGENNFMYGKHHTEETKRKISEAKKGHCVSPNKGKFGRLNPHAKTVVSVDPTTGEEKEYGSIREAARAIGRAPSGIQAVLSGEQNVSGGLCWRYG